VLSILAHFFEHGRWGSPTETGVEGQSLTVQDQLFVLMQAAAYLTATRGSGAPEARICYERAETLSHSLGRPLLLHALIGQWRYTFVTDKLSAAMQVAERVYSLAQEQDDSTLIIWAHNALAATHYFLGHFESARQYAMRGIQIWRSRGVPSHPEDVDTAVVGCLCYNAFSEWHLGEIASCQAKLGEAISLAKELNDMHALAQALGWAAGLAANEGNPAEVEHIASEMIELSTRLIGQACRSNLRGISPPESECFRRTCFPTSSLVTLAARSVGVREWHPFPIEEPGQPLCQIICKSKFSLA
jgi:hypothetical protein